MDIGALSLDDIILLIVGVLVAILILRLIFGSIGKIIGLVINIRIYINKKTGEITCFFIFRWEETCKVSKECIKHFFLF